MAYQTLAEFRDLTILPAEYIDAVELVKPGWVALQLEHWTSWIDSRLRKRYAAPFVAPVPLAVQSWLTRIVTLRVLLRRGVDPTDAQFEEIKSDHDAAVKEVEEAANSIDGLFDLPLRENTVATGIVKGAPRSYTEASPYVWADVQRDVGGYEDRARRGT